MYVNNILFLLGKSTLLSVLGNREVPIPDHVDIFHLTREMPASDKSALQCVMEVGSYYLYKLHRYCLGGI